MHTYTIYIHYTYIHTYIHTLYTYTIYIHYIHTLYIYTYIHTYIHTYTICIHILYYTYLYIGSSVCRKSWQARSWLCKCSDICFTSVSSLAHMCPYTYNMRYTVVVQCTVCILITNSIIYSIKCAY